MSAFVDVVGLWLRSPPEHRQVILNELRRRTAHLELGIVSAPPGLKELLFSAELHQNPSYWVRSGASHRRRIVSNRDQR